MAVENYTRNSLLLSRDFSQKITICVIAQNSLCVRTKCILPLAFRRCICYNKDRKREVLKNVAVQT